MAKSNFRLLLCSGSWHFPDYVTVDADPANRPDIVSVLPPLPDVVKALRWQEILLVHGIEHFSREDGLELVRQCHDCLSPEGKLVLEQPNLTYLAKAVLGLVETPPEEFLGQYGVGALYGDPRSKSPFMRHQWMYSPESLTDLLVEAGFNRDRVHIEEAQYHRPCRDFRIVGTKQRECNT